MSEQSQPTTNHEDTGTPAFHPHAQQVAPKQTPSTQASASSQTVEHPGNNPAIIVLQWLTYALWGWTVLGMSVLTATVISHFVSDSTDWGFTPYGIAAVLVLLPLSITSDFFYSKHEPAKKVGVSSVVMVIHAVLFALFGVGSLVVAAFSIVSLFTSSSDTSNSTTVLFSALLIFVLYLATLLRTLNPAQLPFIRRAYILFMAVSVGVISILGIVGPVAHAHQTRNDTLIENNLSIVNDAINNYAQTNSRLPDTLNSLNLTGDAQKLVSDNLVTYTPNTRQSVSNSTTSTTQNNNSNSGTSYYYQLCVTYKEATKNDYSYSQNTSTDSYGYANTLVIYNHPAGYTCYKLTTPSY